MISARLIKRSLNPIAEKEELLTFVVTFPRMILAELNTHRMFSRNTSSSRAVPFSKMVEAVKENPFIPVAWQKPHKGMQGNEYVTDPDEISLLEGNWLKARDNAVEVAEKLSKPFDNLPEGNTSTGVTKQLCNRLLEPFMWTTMVITTNTSYFFNNFMRLRGPRYFAVDSTNYYKRKQECIDSGLAEEKGFKSKSEREDMLWWLSCNSGEAEIHIQMLAEKMLDEYFNTETTFLRPGQWHIPFSEVVDRVNINEINYFDSRYRLHIEGNKELDIRLALSTALIAKVSYTDFDLDYDEIDPHKLLILHAHLIKNNHMSPTEHCAKAMSETDFKRFLKGSTSIVVNNGYISYSDNLPEASLGWCNNFRGFIPYRYSIVSF